MRGNIDKHHYLLSGWITLCDPKEKNYGDSRKIYAYYLAKNILFVICPLRNSVRKLQKVFIVGYDGRIIHTQCRIRWVNPPLFLTVGMRG